MGACAWDFAGELVVDQLALVAIKAVGAGSILAELDGSEVCLIFDLVCACTDILSCFFIKSFEIGDARSMAIVPRPNIIVHLSPCFLIEVARHRIRLIILKLQPKAPLLCQTSRKALAKWLLTDLEKRACCKPGIRILDPILIIFTPILYNLWFACVPVAMQVSAEFEIRALIFVLCLGAILNYLLAFIVDSLLHTCVR